MRRVRAAQPDVKFCSSAAFAAELQLFLQLKFDFPADMFQLPKKT